MVSITNLSAGQAGTYYSKDSYYTKEKGEWQGKGAEAVGLSGEIRKEDFLNLIEGKNPQGNELVSANSQGEHRAGVDLSFSAAKTVSIAHEILGDERVKDAHDKAVKVALEYTERNFSQCRITEDMVTERINTGNLVISKFEHEVSRELDPQLHTHCVVMNMTRREDGEWRALSNERLYENKILIGQIYRNELTASLKELGYSIQSDEKGLFEIQGIEQKLVDAFSQRSEQIDAKVKELKEQYPNADESKLREMACLGSRVAKKDVDMEMVRGSWQEKIKDLGYTKEGIRESVHEAARRTQEVQKDQIRLNEYDYLNLSLKAITEQESVFKREEVLKIAGRLSVGEQRIDNLEKAFNELNGDREIAKLGKDREGNEIYTTKEVLKIEKEIIENIKGGQGSFKAVMSKEQVEKIIPEKYPQLTQDQKDAATHILTSQDKYLGIQGDAGTGKTSMLNAVRQELEVKGYEVVGLAKTGKAAEELYKGAGIESQTIDSFLQRESKSDDSKSQKVFIVDESSMVGSKKMYELMNRAESQNIRVVLCGDTKQLQSIEAGGIFGKLQESGAIKTVEMKEVLRQKTEEYKNIVKAVSEKEIDTAFEKLEAGKEIQEIVNREERLNAIVRDYCSKEDYKNTLVVTGLNKDRNEINSAIREELKTKGKLQGEEYSFTVRESKGLNPTEKHFAQSYSIGEMVSVSKAGTGGMRAGAEARITEIDQQEHKIKAQDSKGEIREIDLKRDGEKISSYTEKEQSFCEGDRVVFLKNNDEIGVKNGTVGTIKNIDDHGNIKVKTDGGESISLNTKFYNYIDHGYATTDYRSQGQTSREVIFNADTSKENSFNSFYVAVTRGKEDVRVYTDSKENLKGQVKEEQIKTSTLDHDKEFQTDKLEHRINKIADEYSKASERVDEMGERLERGDKNLTEKEILDTIGSLERVSKEFDKIGAELMKEDKELERRIDKTYKEHFKSDEQKENEFWKNKDEGIETVKEIVREIEIER